jgi:hypothetical protein
MRKLPARYTPIALPIVLSTMMTFIVSGIATVKIVGFSPDLLSQWMSAWGWSWVVACPTILFVMPLARRLVALIVEPLPGR